VTRRRGSHDRPTLCPACGAAVTRPHAVHIHGEVFHAHCVLYRGGGRTAPPAKEAMESR
jgi:hypothetical protein